MDEKDLIARLRDYHDQVLKGFRHISRLDEANLIQAAIDQLQRSEDLPESLAASIMLYREDPTAWWAEWQRKHDFNVKLITENERLKALAPSSPVADSPTSKEK